MNVSLLTQTCHDELMMYTSV